MSSTASNHNLNQQVIEINYVEVDTFADLPLATERTGEILVVLTPTGSRFLFNLKRAGFYLSEGGSWRRLGALQDVFDSSLFTIFDNGDTSKKLIFDIDEISASTIRKIIMPDRDIDLNDVVLDKQALVNNRKPVGQIVTTLSGENDNIITFTAPNPAPTAPTIIDFDGTILSVFQRHPVKFSELNAYFVFTNSHNASVMVTVNLRVSLDGGLTYPLIVNSETFPMLPRSGAVPSSVFPEINEWISPQPSSTPVLLKVQVFADVAGVVSVDPGSVFVVKGVYV